MDRPDPGLYHDDLGMWGVNLSGADYATAYASFGYPGAQPAAADFDGDAWPIPRFTLPPKSRWLLLSLRAALRWVRRCFGRFRRVSDSRGF